MKIPVPLLLAAFLAAAVPAAAYGQGPGEALTEETQEAGETQAEETQSGETETGGSQAQEETQAGEAQAAEAGETQEAGETAESGASSAEVPAEEAEAEASKVLADNVLSYDEVRAAIHNGSPSLTQALARFNTRIETYTNARDRLKFEQADAYGDYKTAYKDGDADADALKAEYKVFKNAAHMYKRMYDNMTSWSSMATYRQMERQLTVAAQSLMISYESLRHQEAAMRKAEELYGKRLGFIKTKRAAGLATDAEVTGAEAQYLSAQAELGTVRANLADVYASLCYAVGRENDGSLVIAEITPPEGDVTASMDLAADTVKAVGNNSTLISRRHANRGSATTTTQLRMRTNAEGEQKMAAKMRQLYEDVLQKQGELGTAGTAHAAAAREWQNAQLKYSAGLTDLGTYLEAEMAWLNGEAAYKAAELAYTQAVDTYRWAVEGVANLD